MGKVLIADDNVDLAGIWREFLRMEGHDVDVAHDGPATRRSVQANAYDVVILDVQMPQGEAANLADLVDIALAQPSFIVVSGSFSGGDTESADLPPGAAAVLAKPVDVEKFVATVNRLA